jgi:hypothetical protein
MKKPLFNVFCLLAASLLGIYTIGGGQWLGGDTIPNQNFLEYTYGSISRFTKSWGLPGPSIGFAFINSLPFGISVTLLELVFGAYADSIYFGIILYIFFSGWFKLFNLHSTAKPLCIVTAICLFGSPYSWFLLNRNVYFQIILLTLLPWVLLALRNLAQAGSLAHWVRFAILFAIASPSLINPGYAVPLAAFVFIYLGTYTNLFAKPGRVVGILCISGIVLSPIILGFINLLFNSESISNDYWNNVVLATVPLEIQRTTNVLSNVFTGYNMDTLSSYGYINGKEYFPFWAATLQQDPTGLIFFIPLVLAILMYAQARKIGETRVVSIWVLAALLLLFAIKASAPPFGDSFFDLMTHSSLFKIFRGPHLKFGYLYSIALFLIILQLYSVVGPNLQKLVMLGLSLLAFSSAVVPLAARVYVPALNLVKNVPSEYFEGRDFLQGQNALGKSLRLGVILPSDGSTWHSTNWGYEGYHILHWICPGISFLNRTGNSFNPLNGAAFEALTEIQNQEAESLEKLSSFGFQFLIYDKSINNSSRFFLDDQHSRNIKWLDSTNGGLVKIFENNRLLIYTISQRTNP